MRISCNKFQNNFFVTRLHREALKQSATDPLSGKIDVGILTTGLSTTARKNRAELVAKIKDMLKAKCKQQTMPWEKLLSEIRESAQIVSKLLNGKCNKTPRIKGNANISRHETTCEMRLFRLDWSIDSRCCACVIKSFRIFLVGFSIHFPLSKGWTIVIQHSTRSPLQTEWKNNNKNHKRREFFFCVCHH